jgi:Activator of Hsp90 ATPase homolog 1-like protein
MSSEHRASVGDAATVSVIVEVEPTVAFDVFTREIDQWWRRGPAFRGLPDGAMLLEPHIGGRLLEGRASSSSTPWLERGRVTVWEPPVRLTLTWRSGNFAPDEQTEVDVRFEAVAAGTRVTVRHSGWASLRPDHPARHGKTGPAMSHEVGAWWGALCTALREYLHGRR